MDFLSTLSYELKLYICKKISSQDLFQLRRVNKVFREFLHGEEISEMFRLYSNESIKIGFCNKVFLSIHLKNVNSSIKLPLKTSVLTILNKEMSIIEDPLPPVHTLKLSYSTITTKNNLITVTDLTLVECYISINNYFKNSIDKELLESFRESFNNIRRLNVISGYIDFDLFINLEELEINRIENWFTPGICVEYISTNLPNLKKLILKNCCLTIIPSYPELTELILENITGTLQLPYLPKLKRIKYINAIFLNNDKNKNVEIIMLGRLRVAPFEMRFDVRQIIPVARHISNLPDQSPDFDGEF